MTPTIDVVRDYLTEVERLLAGLPPSEREEVLAGLREHIAAALAEGPADDGTYARQVIDRLGPPAAIAAEARSGAAPAAPVAPPRPRPDLTHEYFAIGLISIGSVLLPFAGWLVGIVLVWTSKVFRPGDKALATMVVPFGFWSVMLLGGIWGPLGIVLFLLFAGGPLLTTCVLLWRVHRYAL